MKFREFIQKGNVLDLAVAVVMGTAFGKIVNSAVKDLIMPIIGFIAGGIDVTSLNLQIGEIVLNYGVFMQSVIDFLIIALVIYIFIRARSSLTGLKKSPEQPTTKTCPYCRSNIHIEAIRCPNCTTILKKRG